MEYLSSDFFSAETENWKSEITIEEESCFKPVLNAIAWGLGVKHQTFI